MGRFERLPGIRRVPSLMRPMEDGVVFFESWHGRYADSPRAISEELQRRGLPVERVWAVGDPAAHVPDGVTVVEPGTLSYLEQLGRARFLVSNNTMPPYFRKKPGSTYLQTWHGTPLKRIAFDLGPGNPVASPAYFAQLRREIGSWDFLISPNRFSTEVFRTAFHFHGEIVETGYPRNDLLSSPERDQVREQVREELGLEGHVRAVLYAPTWRDNAEFSSALDLDGLAEAVGSDHVFLLRAHERVAHTVVLRPGTPVRDVSAYPDIRELYLAADVLVTDYSSAMFDFAVTRKPMLFFTYDLATYRDELRGFYFDFEAEAPGPLLETTGALMSALGDLDAVSEEHGESYERFVERFCHLDDGHASARVVEAVFERAPSPTPSRDGGAPPVPRPAPVSHGRRVSPEAELMFWMVGTAGRRRRMESRILTLLEEVDFTRLVPVLDRQGLVPLIGARLEELAPDRLPRSFHQLVEQTLSVNRRRVTLHGGVSLRLVSALASAGIVAVPLKGPLLADDIYGDAGLRISEDIDLLVARHDLDAAVAELEHQGYRLLPEAEGDGLPRLHHVLESAQPGLPQLELHWRVHWYETSFSPELLARSEACSIRGRRPAPVDDLTALLLFFCRDGFVGMRYAGDIAAWWDAHGEELEPRALDPIVRGHPELADGLLTSVQVAETMTGLPSERLTSLPQPHTRRAGLARHLADWSIQGSVDQVAANVTLVDWLLCPPGGYRDVLRRTLFPSRPDIRRMYRLGEDAKLLTLLWQVAHGPKLLLRYLAAIWSTRGQSRWAPVQAPVRSSAQPARLR